MPTVLNIDGFRLFFYSNEGDPREEAHVHVEYGSGEAKFWIDPHVKLCKSHGMNQRQLRIATELTIQHRARILDFWHSYFKMNR
jgi:hypothetical protein